MPAHLQLVIIQRLPLGPSTKRTVANPTKLYKLSNNNINNNGEQTTATTVTVTTTTSSTTSSTTKRSHHIHQSDSK